MLCRWIPAIIFWALFIVSIGLYERYPWLDTVWYFALLFFILFVAVYSVVHIHRHRHEATAIAYQGVPRWLERFFLDERDDQPRRTERRH